ncbi:hypothetical protein L211DRAFT_508505 [Terfezia boudieri ATCC MYA-4762]|uniref:Uncharacterized protein n=1 Tax=Terfezia boudieri ATCC MYA-4762 TaxID=1051890 RepID=A0A3N4LIV5_9PEZI|nr:hypothetical protein L211DRAFT_508505 [Terfezia boudieri ATCC MYA-4762]
MVCYKQLLGTGRKFLLTRGFLSREVFPYKFRRPVAFTQRFLILRDLLYRDFTVASTILTFFHLRLSLYPPNPGHTNNLLHDMRWCFIHAPPRFWSKQLNPEVYYMAPWSWEEVVASRRFCGGFTLVHFHKIYVILCTVLLP